MKSVFAGVAMVIAMGGTVAQAHHDGHYGMEFRGLISKHDYYKDIPLDFGKHDPDGPKNFAAKFAFFAGKKLFDGNVKCSDINDWELSFTIGEFHKTLRNAHGEDFHGDQRNWVIMQAQRAVFKAREFCEPKV